MRRFCIFLLLFCLWLAAASVARADSYQLLDGTTIEGEPIQFTATGVMLKTPDGKDPRLKYDTFTQDALKKLYKEAPRPEDKASMEPYITDFAQEKIKQREIEIKPVPRLERPTIHTGLFAAFGSSVGLVLILLIYAGNLYAAYEISIFRHMPPGPVCGISAVAPVIGPIVFLCLKRAPAMMTTGPATTTTETTTIAEIAETTNPGAIVTEIAQEGPISRPEPAAPKLPEPILYKRGEFSFNRRFFETKMPGFFRVVPSEKEKDLILQIKSARGEFVGRRISRIGPNDFDLEVFKENATANETIPFIDLYEVHIRHKDLPLA